VEAVIFRLLRKVPALRFDTMSEACAALQAMDKGARPVDVPDERLPAVGPDGKLLEASAIDAGLEPAHQTHAGPAAEPEKAGESPPGRPGQGRLVPALLVGFAIGGAIAWAVLRAQ
jgi:hypothetical protein